MLCARIFSDIFQKFTEYVSNKKKSDTIFVGNWKNIKKLLLVGSDFIFPINHPRWSKKEKKIGIKLNAFKLQVIVFINNKEFSMHCCSNISDPINEQNGDTW